MQVRLADGVHQVKLEHGTASGKRVIIVDGKEVSCRRVDGYNSMKIL